MTRISRKTEVPSALTLIEGGIKRFKKNLLRSVRTKNTHINYCSPRSSGRRYTIIVAHNIRGAPSNT